MRVDAVTVKKELVAILGQEDIDTITALTQLGSVLQSDFLASAFGIDTAHGLAKFRESCDHLSNSLGEHSVKEGESFVLVKEITPDGADE